MTLTLGRKFYARQSANETEEPDSDRHWKVSRVVKLTEHPFTRNHRDHETSEINQPKGKDSAPGKCVADSPVQGVGPVFRETDNVRPRLATRQLPSVPSDTGPISTKPSHAAMRMSNPLSNKSTVSGPGVMKKTQTQMGQWFTR